MFTSLRARLLLSYIVVIGLTLCAASVALVLLIASSPLPNRLTYQRLRDIARTTLPQVDLASPTLDDQLTRIAQDNGIRILRVTPQGAVLFDSAALFAVGEAIDFRNVQRSEDGMGQIGTYRDARGRLWLYVGVSTRDMRRDVGLIVYAAPRLSARPYELLGVNLLRPLIQAGLIGLVVAILLAAAVSTSVARPLRRASRAARAIAGGDYSQRVPERGPLEARAMARAFNQMADRVQRTQQMQRDFLANVSHELKTPLTSIQGYSQAILDGVVSDPSHAARIIHGEAGRMQRLVEDLLDLARIESGQVQLRREAVDLTQVLDRVLSNLTLRAAQKQVMLIREIAPLPCVVGDGDRLAQVFTNLLDNAITHTPQGGQVAVRAALGQGGVVVAVSDSGPGIPATDLSRIFERFYQVEKSRQRSTQHGSGLGLAICKEIVEAHGGRIYAESEEGRGATFTVWLPLPRPADQTAVRASAGPSGGGLG